ncbi:hypothetical protein FNV43_RR16411 [Rhamnella rubrinervis]|uniref:Uncharacterized protein n=1 Tax=Rhamnella rubrinervis TaxID=2594499 RepID=A0A8K0GYR4_9ROSA|nr:hypothetical protein FNV43_RR16411 [Rhamnella rubrinervis]
MEDSKIKKSQLLPSQRYKGFQQCFETKRKYYEPSELCIGPIHHGNPKFQVSDKYKPKLTAKFIEDSGSTNDGEDLYMKIRDNIEELRDCYEEEVTKSYDDETLAWMLFLDGCSTLQFIKTHQFPGQLKNYFDFENEQISFAYQGLFLLENQLPYRVLKLLMSVGSKTDYKDSIIKFIRNNVMVPKKFTHNIVLDIEREEPAHLLELLQFALLHELQKKEKQQMYERGNETKESDIHLHSCYNVQELRAAGIQLKPSGSCCLRDITFNSLCFSCHLKIPPMTVDDSTGLLFCNLIAYEMLPDNIETEYVVTSYISFVYKLVSNAGDVKDLRSANVLINRLGSDLDVSDLFNEIGTAPVPDLCGYTKVKAQIQKHFDSTFKIPLIQWKDECVNTYFRSPWTAIALLGAILTIVLGGIQTFATLYPPHK